MRDWTGRRRLERAHSAGDEAEAFDVVFVGPFEQQLHAETDAERGAFERADRVGQVALAQACHRVPRRSHAWQDDAIRRAQCVRIGGHFSVHAQPRESVADRGDIAVIEIDDGKRHSRPFVLGNTSPSARIACRSARPNALNAPSVLWWSFSPATAMWIAAFIESARLRKTWAVISVG